MSTKQPHPDPSREENLVPGHPLNQWVKFSPEKRALLVKLGTSYSADVLGRMLAWTE